LNLNIIINQGDKLENIPIIRAPLDFKDRKEGEFRVFRSTLLNNGIAGWFYKGYFWALPVNASLNMPVTKIMCSELFSKEVNWEDTAIQEFEPNTWFHLGITLVRDSLTFSLRKKFENNKNMRTYTKYPAFTVFDKEKVACRGTNVNACVGFAIDKIIPIDRNNLGICPYLDYEVFETNGEIVTDITARKKYLYAARRCHIDEYKLRFQHMFDRVFPVSANISNKRLLFNNKLDISVTS